MPSTWLKHRINSWHYAACLYRCVVLIAQRSINRPTLSVAVIEQSLGLRINIILA